MARAGLPPGGGCVVWSQSGSGDETIVTKTGPANRHDKETGEQQGNEAD